MRNKGAKRNRSRQSLIFTGGLFFLGVGILLFIFGKFAGDQPARPFEPNAWKTERGNRDSTIRLEMVKDLLASDDSPVGKTKDQVTEYLGEPEDRNYFSSDYERMYRLGKPGGLIPGPRYLVLGFDSKGRCNEARVLAD